MEHPILFISIILEKLGLPVPHGFVGHGILEQLCAPYMTYTWLVMAFLYFVSKLTVSNLEMVPGKGQNFWEIVIGGLDEFFADNMGRKLTDQFFPMLTTFGLYIAVANLIGLIPGFMSPTSSLNTTLALTIIVWVSHHYIGIREHGIGYYKHFMGPMWWLVPLMLPIELISNAARLLSLSIRLFGNIMGGSIIILVVSYLTWSILLPPFLYAFFGMFVGTIQAFVFTMLTVVYISVQVK